MNEITEALEGLKRCSSCGELKSYEHYSKHKTCKGGVRSICKKCCLISAKDNYWKNPEKANEKSKRWRNKNIEIVRQKNRERNKSLWESGWVKEYRDKNKEHYLKYRREWRAKNNEKESERSRLWRINNIKKCKESEKKSKLKRKDKDKKLFKVWAKNNKDKIVSSRKRRINLLYDSYIRRKLIDKGFTDDTIVKNPLVIELQKQIIKNKRLCKTLENSEMI
jgi:hypothetical protein